MLQAGLLYCWSSSIITREEVQGLRFSQWRWGGGGDEESGVPGYDTISIGEQFPTFQRVIVPTT